MQPRAIRLNFEHESEGSHRVLPVVKHSLVDHDYTAEQMALRQHRLPEHHVIDDPLRHDIRRLDHLREVECLLCQGY